MYEFKTPSKLSVLYPTIDNRGAGALYIDANLLSTQLTMPITVKLIGYRTTSTLIFRDNMESF